MKSYTIINLLLFSLSVGYTQSTQRMEVFWQNADYPKVIVEADKILATTPDHLDAALLKGRAFVSLGEYESAKPLLEYVTENSTSWRQAWAYADLGICSYMTGQLLDARQQLENVIVLSATKNATNTALKRLKNLQLTPPFNEWQTLETTHLRFHFQPDHSIIDLEAYAQQREAAYKKVNVFFKAKLPKKIDYYIWSKPEQAKLLMGRELGFSNPSAGIINATINQTLGHEITHVISHHALQPITKNRFINEGVAVAFDLSDIDRLRVAKVANQNKLKIKQLMKRAEELPESMIYPIGGAFIIYLLEIGTAEQLRVLLKNQTWDTLVETYGKETIETFDKQIK